MPLLNYACPSCQAKRRVLVARADTKVDPKCQSCGRQMEREAQAPTSRVVEVLDNGVMSRRVERPADAERLYKERDRADQERRKDPGL